MTISRLPRGKRMSCWDVCNGSLANQKKIFAPRLRDCRQGSWKRSFGYWLLGQERNQRSAIGREMSEAENAQLRKDSRAGSPTPNAQHPIKDVSSESFRERAAKQAVDVSCFYSERPLRVGLTGRAGEYRARVARQKAGQPPTCHAIRRRGLVVLSWRFQGGRRCSRRRRVQLIPAFLVGPSG